MKLNILAIALFLTPLCLATLTQSVVIPIRCVISTRRGTALSCPYPVKIKRNGIRAWIFCLVLPLLFGIAGCDIANISSNVELLPAISPLPTPQLPDWIEQISPKGEVESLAQIRIRFKDALIPVESLDSPQQQELLKKFEILPHLPGQFRFLTPRMVGFQADKALPQATRIQVSLKAGLEDLKHHRLNQDLAWTFNTESIKLSNLPSNENSYPILTLKPTLNFTSNVELDLNSLKEHVKLIAKGEEKGIPLKITIEESDDNQPQEKIDSSLRDWSYTIIPQQELKKATRYSLEFSKGLRPVHGNLPSEKDVISQVETYSPLKFAGIEFVGQADQGENRRFAKGSAVLKFNNELVAESAIAAITVTPTPPPKKGFQLVESYENSNTVALNPWLLEPATTYTVKIGANLKDKYGQTLGNPVTVQYETGDVAANIWAPSGLTIFPTNTDLQLKISTINLPESKYEAAYRVVQPKDLVYSDYAYPSAREEYWLSNTSTWKSFPVLGEKNQLTNITVPLGEKLGASTGMLAYGIGARTTRYQQNDQQEWREPTFCGFKP